MQETIAELTTLFREVFENDNILLSEETSAADIEEWDSLSHIILVSEIEKRFKIRFTSVEIAKFKNVGDLAKAILAKN